MLVLPQEVEVEVRGIQLKYYEDLGYVVPKVWDKKVKKYIIKRGTKITINVEHLTNANKSVIKVFCDYCGKEECIPYLKFYTQMKASNKYNCKKCLGKKISESKMKYTYEDVLNSFLNVNYTLLTPKEAYKTSDTILYYKCNICGHEARMKFTDFNEGTRCQKCKRKELADLQRFSYNYVYDCFIEQGCLLLSNIYKNKDSIMDYICSCGKESKISFSSFQSGSRCKECGYKKIGDKKRLPYQIVSNIFENNGCHLLSKTYKNSNQKLLYICECGHEDEKDLYHFIRGQRCNFCACERKATQFRHDYDFVYKQFSNKGFKLLSPIYYNMAQQLEYICTCGNIAFTTLNNLRVIKSCNTCHQEKNNISSEKQLIRGSIEYKNWRNEVFKRDNYVCQKCFIPNQKLLNAHHKDGFHWCDEKRLDVDNGVTLCIDCHEDFHSSFGNWYNTLTQFDEWTLCIKNNYIKEVKYECI